jgi:hypothetical protein
MTMGEAISRVAQAIESSGAFDCLGRTHWLVKYYAILARLAKVAVWGASRRA